MFTIKAVQEHYCLVTDGESWTVIERRAGKYYPLGNCSRRLLASVATEWRYLFEHVR
jgi:hypothetical protein